MPHKKSFSILLSFHTVLLSIYNNNLFIIFGDTIFDDIIFRDAIFCVLLRVLVRSRAALRTMGPLGSLVPWPPLMCEEIRYLGTCPVCPVVSAALVSRKKLDICLTTKKVHSPLNFKVILHPRWRVKKVETYIQMDQWNKRYEYSSSCVLKCEWCHHVILILPHH